MPITVDLVEELGSDEYVYGHAVLEGESERFTIRTPGHETPGLGQVVNVRPQSGRHHAFHAVTGVRL
jgi:multiple sugar transport system ATP-binding protein